MADTAQIANMLGGFSAGLSGNLPQWQQVQNQTKQLNMAEKEAAQKKEEERQKTYFVDAYTSQKLLEQGNIDGVISMGLQRLQYLQKLGADPSDTQRLTQLAIAAKNGSQEAIGHLKNELDSAVQFGIAEGVIQPPKGPELVKGSDVVNGQVITVDPKTSTAKAIKVADFQAETPEGFKIVTGEEARAMGLDPKLQYKVNTKTNEPSVLGSGGVTVNTAGKADSAYLNTRAGDQAKAMTDLEKSAESAYRSNVALDRFISSSAKGDKGAAQPFITGAKNLIASFGYSPEGLSDTNKMEQAVGDILGQKMSELGARGLTDKDMEVLRQALPRVNTSHEARVQIAQIIKKSNEFTLGDYVRKASNEDAQYPDYEFARPSWLNDYKANSAAPAESDPLGLF